MKYKSIHIRSPKEDEDLSCFLVQTPSNEIPSTFNSTDQCKDPSDKVDCLIIPSPSNNGSKKISDAILQTTTEIGSLLAKVENQESQVFFVNSPPRAVATMVNPYQDGNFDINKLLSSNIVLLNQNTRTKTSEKTILLKRTSHYFRLWWKLYQSFHYNRKRIKKAIIKEWKKSMNQPEDGKQHEGVDDDLGSEASDETVIDVGGGSSALPYYPKSSIVPTPHVRAAAAAEKRMKSASQHGKSATPQQSHPRVIIIDIDAEDDVHSISSSIFHHQISPIPSAVIPIKENIKLPQQQRKKSTLSTSKKAVTSKQPTRAHELTATATKLKHTVSRNDIPKEVILRKSKEVAEPKSAKKKIEPTSVVSRVRSNDSNHSHHSQKPLVSAAYPNLRTINAMVALYEQQQQQKLPSFSDDLLHENESVVSSLSSMSVLKDRGGRGRIIAGKPTSKPIFSNQKAVSIEEMIPSSSPHHLSLSPHRSPKFSPDGINVRDNSSINTAANTNLTHSRSLTSMLHNSRFNQQDTVSLCNIEQERSSQNRLLLDQTTVTSQKSGSIQLQQPPTLGRKLKEKLARYSSNNQPSFLPARTASPSRFQARYDSPEKEKMFWNEKSLSEKDDENVSAMKNRLSLIKQKITTVTSPSLKMKVTENISPMKAKMNPLQQVLSNNTFNTIGDNQQEQREIQLFNLKILKQFFYKFRQYNTKAYFSWNLIQQSAYYYQMKMKRKFLKKLQDYQTALSTVKKASSFSPPPAAPTVTPPTTSEKKKKKTSLNLLSWRIKDSLRSNLTKLPSFRYQDDYNRYDEFLEETIDNARREEEEQLLEHVWGDDKLAYEYVLRKWNKRSEVTLYYYQEEMKGWNHYKIKNLKYSLSLWKEWKIKQKQFEIILKQKLKKPFDRHSIHLSQIPIIEKKKQYHNDSIGATILSSYLPENSDHYDINDNRKEQSDIQLNISEGDSFHFNDNDSIYLSDDSTHSSIVFKYHDDNDDNDVKEEKMFQKSVKFSDGKNEVKRNIEKEKNPIIAEKSSGGKATSSFIKNRKKPIYEIPIFIRKVMLSCFHYYQAYRFYLYSQQLKGLHHLLMNSVNRAMRNQLKEFSEDHYQRKTIMRLWNRWKAYDPASSLLSYNSAPRVSISLAPSPAYVSSVVSPSNLEEREEFSNMDFDGGDFLTADLVDDANHHPAFLFEDTNIIIDTTSLDLSDYESYNSD
jgi:hypothetical protein